MRSSAFISVCTSAWFLDDAPCASKWLLLQKTYRPILCPLNASGVGPVRYNSALSARGQAAGLILLRYPRFVKKNQTLSNA
jgi:hypothetical protein